MSDKYFYPSTLLKKNSVVGIIAPSSPVSEKELVTSMEKGVKYLESLDLKVKKSKHVLQNTGYTAGSACQRASDLNEMFEDSDVEAIFSLWGGHNANDLLNLINYDSIRENPKPFFGASDISVLLNAITKKTGLITFHWINLLWLGLKRYEKSKHPLEMIIKNGPGKVLEIWTSPETVRHGKAQGRLFGGNLQSFEKIIGTTYLPQEKNIILFLEEIDKNLAGIHSSITHLDTANILKNVTGIILGNFHDKHGEKLQKSVNEVFIKTTEQYGMPIIKINELGHEVGNTVMPVGALLEINTINKEIVIK